MLNSHKKNYFRVFPQDVTIGLSYNVLNRHYYYYWIGIIRHYKHQHRLRWEKQNVYKLLHNTTITGATENWKKHNAVKQPTVDCTLKHIQYSGVKQNVWNVIPHTNLGRQKTPSYFKFQYISGSRSLGMSNSGTSNCVLFKINVYYN